MLRFAITSVLLYVAAIAAFNQIVFLLLIGDLMAFGLLTLSLGVAYVTTYKQHATIKQVSLFCMICYILAFPLDWAVENTALPNATTWIGFGLNTVLGVLLLFIALIISNYVLILAQNLSRDD